MAGLHLSFSARRRLRSALVGALWLAIGAGIGGVLAFTMRGGQGPYCPFRAFFDRFSTQVGSAESAHCSSHTV